MSSRPLLFPAALASVMQTRDINQVELAKRSGSGASRPRLTGSPTASRRTGNPSPETGAAVPRGSSLKRWASHDNPLVSTISR